MIAQRGRAETRRQTVLRALVLLLALSVSAPSHAEDEGADAPRPTVSGVVRGVDGEPRAGVTILVRETEIVQTPLRVRGKLQPDSFEPPRDMNARVTKTHRVRTDDAGRFTASPPAGSRLDILIAEDGEHMSHRLRPRAGSREAMSIDHVQRPALPIRCQLVDAKGEGVAGWVEPRFLPNATSWFAALEGEGRERHEPIRTAADGTFRVMTPAGYVARLACCVVDRVVRQSVIVSPGDPGVIRIPMASTDAAVVRGRVTGADGKPAAGARVSVRITEPPAEWPADRRIASFRLQRMAPHPYRGWWATAVADEEGRYEIAALPAGRLEDVLALHPEHPPLALNRLRRRLQQNSPFALDLALRAGGTAEGRVLDEEGRPIQGASVYLYRGLSVRFQSIGAHPYGQWRTQTDEEGRWRIRGVQTGQVLVQVQHEAHVRIVARPPGRFDSRYCTILPGRVTSIDLVMRRGVPVTGYVLEPDGSPVPGVEVAASFGAGSGVVASQNTWQAVSDAAGRFSFPGLPVGGTLRVGVADVNTASNTVPLRLAEGPPAEPIRLYRVGGKPVSGRLLDADGAPLVGVRLELVPDDPRISPIPPARMRVRSSVLSDALGRFRFTDVPDGWWRLAVSQRRAYQLAGSFELTAEMDGVTDLTHRPIPEQVLRVEVRSRGGAPVAGHPVLVHQDPRHEWGDIVLHTDAGGRVAVSHVHRTSLKVSADGKTPKRGVRSGGPRTRLTVVPPEALKEIELPVIYANGLPVPYASVIQNRTVIGTVYAGRTVLFKGEMSRLRNAWIVDAYGERGQPLSLAPYRLGSGEGPLEKQTIELATGHVVQGHVRDAAGEPIADVEVAVRQRLYMGNQYLRRSTRTDASGRFHMTGFDVGQTLLTVVAPEGFVQEGERRVPVDGEIAIRLHKPALLEGRVVDTEGKPFPHLPVMLRMKVRRTGDGKLVHARTDANGRFVFENVHPVAELTLMTSLFSRGKYTYAATHRTVEDLLEPVEIVLQPAPMIEGRIEIADMARTPELTIMISSVPLKDGIQKVVKTRAGDTSFQLGPVSPGRYLIQVVQPDGHEHPGAQSVEVPLKEPLVIKLRRIAKPVRDDD